MKKRLFSLVMMLVITLNICVIVPNSRFTLNSMNAFAAGYSPSAAIQYADRYWSNYNPAYPNCNSIGGDCCNFVSQCLYAGGIPIDSTWKSGTSSWQYCPSFYTYFSGKYEVIINPTDSQVKEGNPVLYYSASKGRWSHAAICTGHDSSGNALVSAHNSDRHNVNWKLGSDWSKRCTIVINGNTDPIPNPTPSGDCFPACGSGYTSIVEALKSIGVDSSMTYRKQIAAANGISGYSGTAGQNTTMLNMLKSGTLKRPGSNPDPVPDPPPVVDYDSVTYFPACSSSYASIIDALKSIGVDSSMTNRKRIAEKNGISGYSGTAEQNTQMLSLLKSGKLLNPDASSAPADTTGKYYPACSSSYTSIVDALKSIGVDSSLSYRKQIAEKNGISGYSGTANQNTQMLNLLKNGQLIRPDYVEPPVIVNYTVTLNANNGFSPISSITVASNGSYVGLPIATREGYTFNGWYTSSDGGSQVSDGNALVSASNHTLYAHWTANTYTISFENNDDTGISTTKKISYGSNYGELTTPARAGYTFLGWYTDSVDGTKIASDSKFVYSDNQTLYAHWKANQYDVSFDFNDGSGETKRITVTYGEEYGEFPQVSRKGYTFTGWYDKNGVSVSSEFLVSTASNHTLTAKWEKIPVESLKINTTSITLKNGEQFAVIANQDNLTYKSNDLEVAVVSKSGIVTALGVGTAIISVINEESDVVQLKVTVIPDNLKGDCNNDGEFTISDAIILQKWLLAVPDTELANWKAADLCEDGKIDVFDLCMMKRMLVENS